MTTAAAVLVAQNAPLELMELGLPKLKAGQVLVQIAYSGICRSQVNEMKGFKGPDRYLPHTLGHEGSGIVLEVGPNVTKVKSGDHVVLSWIKGKGMEAGGCIYTSTHGPINSGPISTFLSQAIISENRLIPIPSALPLREAALLGCALPTGAGVVFNQLQLSKGSSFAVFGVGGVGLSALLAARFLEAHPIIAIDVSDQKLDHARRMGATHCINSQKKDPVEAIKEITSGAGVHGALECVGRSSAMEAAYQATASQGTCIIAGNLPQGETIRINPFDLILGKQIKGSWGGGSDIDRDVLRYTEMAQDRRVPLADLITHEDTLAHINQLFSELEGGRVGRALVRCHG